MTEPTYWQARGRVAEYVRQASLATRPPVDTIHGISTDPSADMAELTLADLLALLAGPPIVRDPDRTAHWGTCDNNDCQTSMLIYPHPDAPHDLPDEEEWEDSPFFIDCPVCGANVSWGGTDHPADLLRNY